MSISASLQKAARLQEKIDDLRKQLADLLNKARQELASTPALEIPATLRRVGTTHGGATKAAAPAKTQKGAKGTAKKGAAKIAKPSIAAKSLQTEGRGGRPSLAGRRRAASPSGPLAPAVVKVLKAKGKPMRVAEILDGLFKNGYSFSSPEPKKNLAARIYRLSGVRQVAGGLFATG